MKLSEYVYKYRKSKKLSLRAMADLCGCSFQYLSKLEKDEIDAPTIQMLSKIAKGMGISLHELLSSVDDMNIYLKVASELDSAAVELQLESTYTQAMEDISKISENSMILLAYKSADERTKKAVRVLLGIEQ